MSVDVVARTVSVEVPTIFFQSPLYLPSACLHRVSILTRRAWDDVLTTPALSDSINRVPRPHHLKGAAGTQPWSRKSNSSWEALHIDSAPVLLSSRSM